ncbi:MAG: metal ABC transporter substrate-binding protein [Planctomycetaceae bacterium]
MNNRLPVWQLYSAITALVSLTLLCGCGGQSGSAPGNAGASPKRSTDTSAQVLVTHPVLLEAAIAITANTGITVAAALPDLLESRDWRPRSQFVRAMQQASLVVMNGASWEPWTSRVSLPNSRLVVTTRGFPEQLISVPDAVTHQHGPQGRHSHPGVIPSTWLSPTLLDAQIDALQSALVQQFREHREVLSRNATAWKIELQPLRRSVQQLRESSATEPPFVIADSPLFLYLMRDLGWDTLYLAGSETGPPEPEQLKQLKEIASGQPAKTPRLFLLSSQRPADFEKTATEFGLQPVRLDTGIADLQGNSIATRLAKNLEALKQALTPVR